VSQKSSSDDTFDEYPYGFYWYGPVIGVRLFTDNVYPVFSGPEQSVLVLGPPRSGKTTALVIPTVVLAPAAVVSTSTKADVLHATYGYRSRSGNCYVFDPTGSVPLPDGCYPLRWSPVVGCENFDAAVSMAHALAVAGRPGVRLSEAAHWVERAEALLAPLLHAAAMSKRHMGDVCRWVLGHDTREAEAVLTATGAQMARVVLSSVWRTEERERSGIFSTAAGLLSAYRSDVVLESARHPNFDPARFAASADTLYVCSPGHAQERLAPLVVALLEQVRAAVYSRRAWFPDAAPCVFALDEAANIAPLPSLPQMAAEGGGQGLVTMACLQDLSQARARWGPEAEGFFSLFSTKVILPGIADARTLELISALGGDEQVEIRSVNRPGSDTRLVTLLALLAGERRPMPRPTVTTSYTWRRRLPVDAVSRGTKGQTIVLTATEIRSVAIRPWWEIPVIRELALDGH
jgi:type IV secretion system protein VirD4